MAAASGTESVHENESWDGTAYTKALGDLRAALAQFKPGQETYEEIVTPRDQVFAKYRPIFSLNHIGDLTRDEFTSFLYFENNRHWSGLYRKGLGAAADLNKLRDGLRILLDESKPIRERFPAALTKVTGLGKATATAILTVALPDEYGVWNNTSEAALRQIGLWPSLGKGEGSGARYEKINNLLSALKSELKVDFWTLDALWWFLLEPGKLAALPAENQSDDKLPSSGFALERQLENFLLENWDKTPLAHDWAIFSTPEDLEAGNQYPTDVGRLDILAVHKHDARLLVIELKRDQTTDQTVGQVLRYMGWIKKHVAKKDQTVDGLIIARKADKHASYALSLLPNVKMMVYEIEFHLKHLEPLPE